MTDVTFQPGDDVIAGDFRGTIIDVRATPSGTWAFGVEDADGAVSYFTARALRLARG